MALSLTNLMQLADTYIVYLASHGVEFNESGYPILDKSCYLSEIPDDLIAYHSRNSCYVKEKSRTALCFYCGDQLIYPRLKQIFDDIPIYKQFMGVVACDITVTVDMEEEWQREILLINQLFIAILAINGIKIIANLRSGSDATIDTLDSIPHGVMCATGTLGCSLINNPEDLRFIKKILRVRPSLILLYGRKDQTLEEQLQRFGIQYKRFDDVHMRFNRRRRMRAIK